MDAPSVAVSRDGKKTAVAWMDTREGGNNRNLYWTVGAPGRFPAETPVHQETRGVQGHPSLAFDGDGTAWCAWEDLRAKPQQVYVTREGLKKDIPVSEASEGNASFPSLAAGGKTLAVAYEARDGVTVRILAAP